MAQYSANTQYEYTNDMEGNFSGGTWTSNLTPVPHPIATSNDNVDTIVQMNAVTIGGFDGLNN